MGRHKIDFKITGNAFFFEFFCKYAFEMIDMKDIAGKSKNTGLEILKCSTLLRSFLNNSWAQKQKKQLTIAVFL